jgi:two-component system CheB/CheR fusion protein
LVKTSDPARPKPEAAGSPVDFPVVGIGASAGGLEALDEFLLNLPEHPGMAFVVVQHLDPNRPAMLVELLQRATAMPVTQASERVRLAPDRVYVIPPNKDMFVQRGFLVLVEPAEPHGRRLPINTFFSSLAADLGKHAVGVILSGMGSDGTLGLRAIRAQGGLTMVETPGSARFDSMPRSAIQDGAVDRVDAPAGLARNLLEQFRGLRAPARAALPVPEGGAFGRICGLLRDRTGHDFSQYKRSTIYRRIERRVGLHGLAGIHGYLKFLGGNPRELDLLFSELLIGVTGFFRDPEPWAHLATEILPRILAAHPEGGTLRAWVAGCSTGEEAYSLAIAFQETFARVRPGVSYALQIFATDLNKDAVEAARRGWFPASALNGLSAERKAAWFQPERNGWRVSKEIRERVVFAVQDVLLDPPFIRLDLLCCRNLLIYMSPDLQKRILPLFTYSLNPNGHLFLGSAESIGDCADLYSLEHAKFRIFTRTASNLASRPTCFPIGRTPAHPTTPEIAMAPTLPNLQILAERALLQQFAPPAALTTETGDILFISGRTGKYLEPAMGKANLNIFAMAREGLQMELSLAYRKALSRPGPVEVAGLKVGTNGGTQALDLVVQVLAGPDGLQGHVMVVFKDQPTPPKAGSRQRSKTLPDAERRIAELELELRGRMEELNSAQEEMQTAQEELKATNEELQSTNEELQSTNEELTTSKEELQSMNEELQTINAEQQAKVDELSNTNNDMRNLLDATDIATLFLDEHLNVRRYTSGATRLFKLIPGDVGRPFTDLVTDLVYPELAADALEVLRTLAFQQKEVQTRDGSAWFLARILPYRTTQNVIAGVVTTFSDITHAKTLEAQLRAAGKA